MKRGATCQLPCIIVDRNYSPVFVTYQYKYSCGRPIHPRPIYKLAPKIELGLILFHQQFVGSDFSHNNIIY